MAGFRRKQRREIDGVVLDESFVDGALFREDELASARRARRRSRRRARTMQALSYAIALGLAGYVVAGLGGYGPLRPLSLSTHDSAATETGTAPSSAPTTAETARGELPSTSTSTTKRYHLERRTYTPGQCVVWTENPSDMSGRERVQALFADAHPTSVVDCATPHFVEMTGHAVVDRNGPYPTDDEWIAMWDATCRPMAAAYLGYPLDPDGLFRTDGVQPSKESWADGDRDLWCGIGRRPDPGSVGASQTPFTGVVKGQSQSRLFADHACLRLDEQGRVEPTPVACDELHALEVAGVAHLPSDAAFPADSEGWQRLVGDQCRALGLAHLGHPFRDGIGWGWLDIPKESWDAGRRDLECTVARYENDVPQHVTAPLATL